MPVTYSFPDRFPGSAPDECSIDTFKGVDFGYPGGYFTVLVRVDTENERVIEKITYKEKRPPKEGF